MEKMMMIIMTVIVLVSYMDGVIKDEAGVRQLMKVWGIEKIINKGE